MGFIPYSFGEKQATSILDTGINRGSLPDFILNTTMLIWVFQVAATIKPIDNRDIANVRSIAWQSWMRAYARFIPERDLQAYFDEHYSVEAFERLFNDASVCGFVAEVAGNAVGYAKACFNKTGNRFYINSIYVLPEHQGGGIGTLLLNASIERARSYNLSEVWLGVMVNNIEALAWYNKIGFKFVREEPFVMGHTTVSHLIGYKPI